MLDGWYCRTLANQSTANMDEQTEPNVDANGGDSAGSDDSFDQRRDTANNAIDYKSQYRYLKRKLKFLIYENEFFQEALRINQRRLLKVSRDRSFLLDRLLQYEKPENTSSESEETESSEDDAAKKRRIEQNNSNVTVQGATRGRKKKVSTVAQSQLKSNPTADKLSTDNLHVENDHTKVTEAGTEHQLQSRPPVMQLNPGRASETVPNEMFSNNPSLDSDSNDNNADCSSPTHVAAEECVPMEYTNN